MQKIQIKNIKNPYLDEDTMIGCIMINAKSQRCIVTGVDEDGCFPIRSLTHENVVDLLTKDEKAFIDNLRDKYTTDIIMMRDSEIDTDLDFYVVGRPYN